MRRSELGLLERMSYDNGTRMPQRRPIEFWRKIRALVEKGLSLNEASKEFGVSYSHLRDRAAVEGWKLTYTHGRGAPRTLDYPDGTKRVEMAKEQARRDAQQAELLLEARVAVFDTKKAELVAQKILAQHSTKMKVALSELVVQTAEDLRSGEVRPKDKALAMVALKTVSNQLYGWDREADIQRMELARTSDNGSQQVSLYQHYLQGTTPPQVTGAVNLALIATSPEELAKLAKANGQWVGPSAISPEQPRAVAHGCRIPEKEAPKLTPEGQPAQGAPAGHPVWETPRKPSDDVTHPAPLSQTPFGQTPQNSFSRPPGWHEHRKANCGEILGETSLS
jgi:hypothetical protein